MEQVGQTRPGRISDAPPGAAAYASSAPAAADPAAFVNETVRGHKVAMFSKVPQRQGVGVGSFAASAEGC